MILASSSPNSSNLYFNGLYSSSCFAYYTSAYTFPISVFIPILTTTPTAEPEMTMVPLNTMLVLDIKSAYFSLTISWSLRTGSVSPVKLDWSVLRIAVFNCSILISAGTLSPVLNSTISPGTSYLESMDYHFEFLRTLASNDYNSFNA